MSPKPERIAKYLSGAGVASRREAERLIAQGCVSVDGITISTPATLVLDSQQITINGVIVSPKATINVWRYHKPKGVLTTRVDGRGRETLLQHLPESLHKAITVGRLDMNSEGLLLLTNDGDLARYLEHPAQAIPRTYRVRVHGLVTAQALQPLGDGVTIDGVTYQPIRARVDSVKGTHTWLTLTLVEGKNREIRKVMQHLGFPVTRLIRTAYGAFRLGMLPRDGVEEVRPTILQKSLRTMGWPCAL